MPELRWILIAVGVLFVAGLWLWESRRPKGPGLDGPAGEEQARPRTEPRIGEPTEATVSGPGGLPAPREAPPPDVPIRATRREKVGPVDPPVVEIPPDVEPELARDPHEREVPLAISYREMRHQLDARAGAGIDADAVEEAERRDPWVRTQPLDREQIKRAQEAEEAEDSARAEEHFGGSADRELASRQRIVAMRLVATGDRWPGRDVVDALEAEGLTFGKYSVFHKGHASGKTLFYVASMIEPGSFDLEQVDSLTFPGVSLFAVVPGPVESPAVFDMMLATGRRLADRLRGQLQDEQGSSLTAQRILNLREELVHLEHLARRIRGA